MGREEGGRKADFERSGAGESPGRPVKGKGGTGSSNSETDQEGRSKNGTEFIFRRKTGQDRRRTWTP